MPQLLSRHLALEELACRDLARTPYPLHWIQTRALPLAEEFEVIRRACGDKPIRVLSAYRTPAHNRAVGGARASQHLEGRALDLAPPKGWTPERFFSVVRELANLPGRRLRGLSLYPTFVHVDIRPTVRLVVWPGARPKADA